MQPLAIANANSAHMSFAENIGILEREYKLHTGHALQLTPQMQQEARKFLVDNYTDSDFQDLNQFLMEKRILGRGCSEKTHCTSENCHHKETRQSWIRSLEVPDDWVPSCIVWDCGVRHLL